MNLPAHPLPTILAISESDSDPHHYRKLEASPQLKRWSRARTIRSGRKLDWSGQRTRVAELNPPVFPQQPRVLEFKDSASERDTTDELDATTRGGKSIYMVSDGTGWTAEHSVNAAWGKFDYCLVDRGCPVNTHLFSGEDGDLAIREGFTIYSCNYPINQSTT